MAQLEQDKKEREEAEQWLVGEKGIVEGARCQVVVPGAGKRRGTVRYPLSIG